jgi:hypothetical protein
MMRTSPLSNRLAGPAGILFLPLALFLAGLAVRLDTSSALRAMNPAALDLNADVFSALRWLALTALALLGTLVVGTSLRRR